MITAKDCRFEGFSMGHNSRWYKIIHLTTGTTVEFANGTLSKREALEALKKILEPENNN